MQSRYNQAKLSIHDRALKVAAVVESLEREMELLCLTGVEDQLQTDVRPTLELLRNAGIKVGLPLIGKNLFYLHLMCSVDAETQDVNLCADLATICCCLMS